MSQRTEYFPEPDPQATSEITWPDRRSLTPIDQLARRLNHVCTTAVDPLQITAALESDGITDRIARDEYGFSDVFDLAEELFRRVPRRLKAHIKDIRGERLQTLRELSHGPLFVLPSVAYPALVVLLGIQSMILGLVTSAAIGWFWSLGMTWLAYGLIGRGCVQEAAQLLRRMSLLGISVVGLAAVVITALYGDGSGVVVFAVSQMAYQMAAAILIVYRLEFWLLLGLLPAILANGLYLISGLPVQLAIAFSIVSVVITLGSAFWATIKRIPQAKKYRPTLTRSEVLRVLPVFAYGALSAAFVLSENVRGMISHIDLGLSITPLVLSMGVLEWQSRRFRERASLLLHQTRNPKEFSSKVWWMFLENMGNALLVVFLVSALGLLVLDRMGFLTSQGVMMFLAYLLLGGVFFVNFALLAQHQFKWVLGSLLGALLFYLAGAYVSGLSSDVPSYFVATALLLVAVLLALRPGLGRISYYR